MRRTFSELRKHLLLELSLGHLTTNQLSIKTGINWRTVEAHLDFLIGEGDVAEIVSSRYVRIFKLTEQGMKTVKSLFRKETQASYAEVKVKINGETLEIK